MSSAMLDYRLNSSTPETRPAFAIANAGGIRATIDQGPITRGEVLTAFPFSNAVTDITLTGERIYRTLEGIVSQVNQDNGRPVTSFLQVSKGISIEYNPAGAVGSRLVSVNIDGKSLDMAAEYRVVTVDFIAGGGDNFLSPPIANPVTLDTLDTVLVDYIKAKSPVDIALDGRIKVSGGSKFRRGVKRRGQARGRGSERLRL